VVSTNSSYALYGSAGIAWAITNGGMLSAGNGIGITLAGGGSVTNGSATNRVASISSNYGVYFQGRGTVVNYGTIAATPGALYSRGLSSVRAVASSMAAQPMRSRRSTVPNAVSLFSTTLARW
jgi:hypothetical protein